MPSSALRNQKSQLAAGSFRVRQEYYLPSYSFFLPLSAVLFGLAGFGFLAFLGAVFGFGLLRLSDMVRPPTNASLIFALADTNILRPSRHK